MKNKLTITLLKACIFFLSVNGIMAQSNEQKIIPAEGGKYVECSHGDGHWTFIPDEVNVDPGVYVSPIGGCPYRPYREMVAYDETLLNTYSKDSIETWISRAYKRFERAMNNSGLTHGGVRLIKIMPVKIEQSYTTLGKLSSYGKISNDGIMDSLLIIKNELYDCDHLTIITRVGIPTSELGLNTQVIVKDPTVYYNTTWKTNLGAVNLITLTPSTLITLAHECGHGLGADHENPFASTITPSYARSYVDPVKQVSDIMKSGSIGSWVVEVFSGPNSKTMKNGETLTIGNDTINNARHVQEVLDMVMCATENHVTRVSLPTTTCGSGKLQAITNNADTFQWKVLSGDCNITGIGQEISYMATSQSKIQVIAQKKGKWYWDTAVVEIPALQHTTLNSSIKKGEFIILPNKDTVYTSGSYTVTLKNQNGCDSLVTINLNVTTSTEKIRDDHLIIVPNPVQEYLYIRNLTGPFNGTIYSISGVKEVVDFSNAEVDVKHLSPGKYFIQIIKVNKIYQKSFIKL